MQLWLERNGLRLLDPAQAVSILRAELACGHHNYQLAHHTFFLTANLACHERFLDKASGRWQAHWHLQIEKHSSDLENLHGSVKAAEAAALQYNAQEAIFGLPATDYTAVKKLAEALEPFHALWTTADRCASLCAAATCISRTCRACRCV